MPVCFREPKRAKRVFSFKCSRDTLKLPVEETRVPKNVYSCTISMVFFPMCRYVEFQVGVCQQVENSSCAVELSHLCQCGYRQTFSRFFQLFIWTSSRKSVGITEKSNLKLVKLPNLKGMRLQHAKIIIAPQSCENLPTFVRWGANLCSPTIPT